MLLRTGIIRLSFVLVTIASMAQKVTPTSTVTKYLNGKTYYCLMNEQCKETTGGGYMVFTHCYLRFKQDSILIAYYANSHRSIDPKSSQFYSYTYSVENKRILIGKHNSYKGNLNLFYKMPGEFGANILIYNQLPLTDISYQKNFVEINGNQ